MLSVIRNNVSYEVECPFRCFSRDCNYRAWYSAYLKVGVTRQSMMAKDALIVIVHSNKEGQACLVLDVNHDVTRQSSRTDLSVISSNRRTSVCNPQSLSGVGWN